MKFMRKFAGLALGVGLVALAACRTIGPTAPILLEVPFREQPEERCGSASIAMVADYYGRPIDQAELDRFAHIPALGGTTPELLAEGAQRQGWWAEARPASWEELQHWLTNGWPVIVMLGPAGADPRGHFVVVTGLDVRRQALRVHSGRERDRWMKRSAWWPRWQEADRRIVLLRRP